MTVSLTLLDETDRSGRNLWRLNEAYMYRLGPYCRVKVPAGYVTNLGTIPRWAFWFVTPAELREASLVHDWMCNEDHVDDGVQHDSGFSRWMADSVLYEIMVTLGISPIRRYGVWLAVRAYARFRGLR